MEPFSRDNPSPEFLELSNLYKSMHTDGYTREINGQKVQTTSEEAFPGNELPKYAAHIQGLIKKTGARTILDYGAGKGNQYKNPVESNGKVVAPSVQNLWGVESITCYDPGVEEFNTLPTGKFDGVVSTDVLEHIPIQDIFWVVKEMFTYAQKFVFCNISCMPAYARLPNGQNAHVTVRPPSWWIGVFDAVRSHDPSVFYSLGLVYSEADMMGNQQSKLAYVGNI